MRSLHFTSVCLSGCVASMVVAGTLSLSAAQKSPSFIIRSAQASWVSEQASKPGDVFRSIVMRLALETTETGDVVDHVQYSDLTYVAVDDGAGGLNLVTTESLVVEQKTLPVGTIKIDPGLRRFAIDQTLPAEHCIATPPNYSPAICNPVAGVHLVAEFIRVYPWSSTSGRFPAQPGEFSTYVELSTNGTADLSVDGVPVSGSCGDTPEVCGTFLWIRFRIH